MGQSSFPESTCKLCGNVLSTESNVSKSYFSESTFKCSCVAMY